MSSSPYAKDFNNEVFFDALVQGDNRFSFGFGRGGGVWSGIIHNDKGLLTGRDLTFIFEDHGMRSGLAGSRVITASAASFNVAAPVPEPGTWALMLLGFLGVGTALRRSAVRAVAPA